MNGLYLPDFSKFLDSRVFISSKLFKILESLGTPLSQKLLKSLKSEVEKRWNTEVVGLLKYLNDPSELLDLEEAEKVAKEGLRRPVELQVEVQDGR